MQSWKRGEWDVRNGCKVQATVAMKNWVRLCDLAILSHSSPWLYRKGLAQWVLGHFQVNLRGPAGFRTKGYCPLNKMTGMDKNDLPLKSQHFPFFIFPQQRGERWGTLFVYGANICASVPKLEVRPMPFASLFPMCTTNMHRQPTSMSHSGILTHYLGPPMYHRNIYLQIM